MALMDKQYLRTPFYGSRKMAVWLKIQGYPVNRKRVQRLMRRIGIEAIYRRPRATRPNSGHRVYPYQVWATDIIYIPVTSIWRTASTTVLPVDMATSAYRSLEIICSGVCFFLGISPPFVSVQA